MTHVRHLQIRRVLEPVDFEALLEHRLRRLAVHVVVAGQKDVEAGAVSFRFRDGSQVNGVPVEQAVDAVVNWIERRENASPSAEKFTVATA